MPDTVGSGIFAMDIVRRPTTLIRRDNMSENLKGMRVAILVTDGFEQSEMEKPREALDAAGAETKVVSPVDVPKG